MKMLIKMASMPARANLDEADAWTIRSLIGWQTKPFKNFSIAAQLINVTQLNDGFYDGTNNTFGSVVAHQQIKKISFSCRS